MSSAAEDTLCSSNSEDDVPGERLQASDGGDSNSEAEGGVFTGPSVSDLIENSVFSAQPRVKGGKGGKGVTQRQRK